MHEPAAVMHTFQSIVADTFANRWRDQIEAFAPEWIEDFWILMLLAE